jgi:hypothetical protein
VVFMLSDTSVRSVYSVLRRAIFPFSYKEQFLSLLPFVLIAIICSILAGDFYLLITLVSLGYFATILSMQHYIPHKLEIPANKVDIAIEILNKIPNLERVGEELNWQRRILVPIFRSDLDSVKLKQSGTHFIVIGRKAELIALEHSIGLR